MCYKPVQYVSQRVGTSVCFCQYFGFSHNVYFLLYDDELILMSSAFTNYPCAVRGVSVLCECVPEFSTVYSMHEYQTFFTLLLYYSDPKLEFLIKIYANFIFCKIGTLCTWPCQDCSKRCQGGRSDTSITATVISMTSLHPSSCLTPSNKHFTLFGTGPCYFPSTSPALSQKARSSLFPFFLQFCSVSLLQQIFNFKAN